LGSALCRHLNLNGHELVILNSKNCNLEEINNLNRYSDDKFDMIYHLAAWTQAGDFCLKHPGEQWIKNQYINTNILNWWNNAQPQAKLVFMGTSCVYAPESSLKECEFMIGEPIESLYTYAMTKRMLYQGAKALNKQFGLNYFCAVPSTLYGPGYHTDGRQLHFIFDLIKKIIRSKEFGEKTILWGDGHQRRELVFVEDFVKNLVLLCENEDNEIYNLGAGEEYEIKYFAQAICNIVDYDPTKIEYDSERYVGARSKKLNMDKTLGKLPNYIKTPLLDGLRTTIHWFYQSGAYK